MQAEEHINPSFSINDVVFWLDSNPHPLTWATGTGSNGATSSVRVKMTNAFWNYTLAPDKRACSGIIGKTSATFIRILRDKTVSLSDVDNLIAVEQGYINIGNAKKYRATELATRLGLDYSDWRGTAIMDLLTYTERKSFEFDANFSPLPESYRKRDASKDDNQKPRKDF
ncbi:hypothetical protein Aduo_015729 [Ancylostoma duodenale]